MESEPQDSFQCDFIDSNRVLDTPQESFFTERAMPDFRHWLVGRIAVTWTACLKSLHRALAE